MRELDAREQEIVAAQRKNPKPVLDIPGSPAPISTDIENWIILMPGNVRQGLIQTIGKMLSSIKIEEAYKKGYGAVSENSIAISLFTFNFNDE